MTALAQEELEWTRAKRMKAQQDLARAAGELVLYGDVLRAWAELMLTFHDQLLIVKDQIALRCDMKTAWKVAEIVGSAHEELLQTLAENGGRVNGSLAMKGPRR